MKNYLCPQCGVKLPESSINDEQGVALCADCGLLFPVEKLREIEAEREVVEELLPIPRSCWLRRQVKQGNEYVVLGLSTRSRSGFCVGLFINGFWNGITSLFFAQVLAGAYQKYVAALPTWFPFQVDNPDTLGDFFLGLLFSLPFVLIGGAIFAFWLMAIGGKTELYLGAKQCWMKVGIGFLGWRVKFDRHEVDSLSLIRDEDKRDDYLIEISFHSRRKAMDMGTHSHAVSHWMKVTAEVLLMGDPTSPHYKQLLAQAASRT